STRLRRHASNRTGDSTDVSSRGVPVRLRFEGKPVERQFTENLLEYAGRHRMEILGELAGMVRRWKENGRRNAAEVWPAGRPKPRHRWARWVEVVGGILGSNGFFNFLSNVEEAKVAMDEGLQALATVAEYVLVKN